MNKYIQELREFSPTISITQKGTEDKHVRFQPYTKGNQTRILIPDLIECSGIVSIIEDSSDTYVASKITYSLELTIPGRLLVRTSEVICKDHRHNYQFDNDRTDSDDSDDDIDNNNDTIMNSETAPNWCNTCKAEFIRPGYHLIENCILGAIPFDTIHDTHIGSITKDVSRLLFDKIDDIVTVEKVFSEMMDYTNSLNLDAGVIIKREEMKTNLINLINRIHRHRIYQ
jgi:hypothetical protein